MCICRHTVRSTDRAAECGCGGPEPLRHPGALLYRPPVTQQVSGAASACQLAQEGPPAGGFLKP